MKTTVFACSAGGAGALAAALALAVACGGSSGGDGAGGGEAGIAPERESGTGVDTGTGEDGAAGDAASGACSGKGGPVGDRTVTITSGGTQRVFDLHVPKSYDGAKPVALVFAFHGFTMTPAQMASATKLSPVSDARGFILAYPAGLNTSFNAGSCCGQSATDGVDDIGFTRDMIATLAKDYCVDPKRVFATGFSNGGFLSYRLACELSDQIAAVAPVSGTLGVNPATCTPKRPVALMHTHGTGDIVVPYNGGGLGANRSVADSIAAIRDKDACPAGDGGVVYATGDVSCTEWGPCGGSTNVKLCTVANGGHQWPGGVTLPYGGTASPDLDASNAILDFFEAHPMP